ncbi:beta-lactamase-like protein [Candidatus Moduliflexus flocculans]|uniref:Beta-lactamase-like protein n=1 Tax=Candidatus Moduliflexus flocculans TaxID=1499966 RepID=A0A0S6VZC7_9BACT|nr:beta-lactamase-like protein [Candidatus Moduliflexus flocculans]
MKVSDSFDFPKIMNNFSLQFLTEKTVAVTQGLDSNAGAIAFDDFIVMVDTTMKPRSARHFRQLVETHFQLPVKFLLITHHHTDHSFGAVAFADTCIVGSTPLAETLTRRKATEWTPEGFAEWKRQTPADAEWLDQVEVLLPTIRFDDAITICDSRRRVELPHVGGHTSCSTYAYLPDENIVFTGDLLFADAFPYSGDATCDPERWMNVLKGLLALDVERFVPGHGAICGKETVEKELRFLQQLKTATIETIQRGDDWRQIHAPATFDVTPDMFWLKEQSLQRFHAFYSQADRTGF